MKRLIAAATLLLSANVSAGTYEECKDVTTLAGSIMSARQAGASLDQVIEAAAVNSIDNELLPIILLAFDERRLASEKYQTIAINDFKSRILKVCMEF
jgi:hypothetical protein